MHTKTKLPQTLAEKILSRNTKNRKIVYAGDVEVVRVKHITLQDATTPLTIEAYEQVSKELDKSGIECSAHLPFDHAGAPTTSALADIQRELIEFALKHGIHVFEASTGVCHQIAIEGGRHKLGKSGMYFSPGDVVVGADSHTTTYGALGVFATGVGSTDAAVALLTGSIWFQVPESFKFNIEGELPEGVYAKDLMLYLIGKMGADGAIEKAIEFHGSTIRSLSMSERFVLSNMAVEMGAVAGLMEVDGKTIEWCEKHGMLIIPRIKADVNAKYEKIINLHVSGLKPQIALPFTVDNVVPISEIKKTKIDYGLLGTCTNGRAEDLIIAARILKGKKIPPNVRFYVAAASREIANECAEALRTLEEAGAIILPPGCGPCVGTGPGIPPSGANVISTANRNFKGRMGSSAEIYLGSPATVAASVLHGEIVDPRDELGAKKIFPLGKPKFSIQEPLIEEIQRETKEPIILKFRGNIHRFGDNISTDIITPGKYRFESKDIKKVIEIYKEHLMEAIDPDFHKKIKEGDIIIAGKNFGCGSSREHAPLALKAAGISCIIAESVPPIFKRNAVNVGLLIIECPEASKIKGEFKIDLANGKIILDDGLELNIKPLSEKVVEIIKAGGLVEYLKKKG